ncbi:unnamed protein product [Xylocopa violacea]|uniref:Uncharacterized protein n=1 Tax=Xylocopa violacea TaxID=135666 RepID=A0ABP1P7I2_XYLVO
MENCSVNASCLARFLLVLLIVRTALFKSVAVSNESINSEIFEWSLERNITQLNSTEHRKERVVVEPEKRNENNDATDTSITPESITTLAISNESITHESNDTQLRPILKSNSSDYEIEYILKQFSDDIFFVAAQRRLCPEKQRKDDTGKCREEFGPNTD